MSLVQNKLPCKFIVLDGMREKSDIITYWQRRTR